VETGRCRRKEGRVFFSEEKKQKTLPIQVFVPPDTTATARAKVFWFFSSEKNAFPWRCLQAAPAVAVVGSGRQVKKADLARRWASP
jgi:hypothetical protein